MCLELQLTVHFLVLTLSASLEHVIILSSTLGAFSSQQGWESLAATPPVTRLERTA